MSHDERSKYVLQSLAVCCSLLQCVVAVCCTMSVRLTCVKGLALQASRSWCNTLQQRVKGLALEAAMRHWCLLHIHLVVCRWVLQCGTVWYSVVQCVAVHCSVWQCVAVCGSVWQCVAVCCSAL